MTSETNVKLPDSFKFTVAGTSQVFSAESTEIFGHPAKKYFMSSAYILNWIDPDGGKHHSVYMKDLVQMNFDGGIWELTE